MRCCLAQHCEQLIVEVQPGAACHHVDPLRELRIGFRHNGWLAAGFYFNRHSTCHESRPPVAPRRRLFVGVRDAQHRFLIEWPADELHPDRQSVLAESARHRDGGSPGDRRQRAHTRCLPFSGEADRAVRVKSRRRSRTVGQESIIFCIERRHLGDHSPALALRLHVIGCREQAAAQRAAEEMVTVVVRTIDQVLPMDGEQLGFGQRDPHIVVLLQRAQLHFFNLCAQTLQHFDRRFHRRRHLRIGRQVALPEMADDADPQTANVFAASGVKIGQPLITASAVARVEPGDRIEQQRAVFDGPRHGPRMIAAGGKRNHPVTRHAPERRLEADDAG